MFPFPADRAGRVLETPTFADRHGWSSLEATSNATQRFLTSHSAANKPTKHDNTHPLSHRGVWSDRDFALIGHSLQHLLQSLPRHVATAR